MSLSLRMESHAQVASGPRRYRQAKRAKFQLRQRGKSPEDEKEIKGDAEAKTKKDEEANRMVNAILESLTLDVSGTLPPEVYRRGKSGTN